MFAKALDLRLVAIVAVVALVVAFLARLARLGFGLSLLLFLALFLGGWLALVRPPLLAARIDRLARR